MITFGIVLVFDREIDPEVARTFVMVIALVVSFDLHTFRQFRGVGGVGSFRFFGFITPARRFILFGIGCGIVVAA